MISPRTSCSVKFLEPMTMRSVRGGPQKVRTAQMLKVTIPTRNFAKDAKIRMGQPRINGFEEIIGGLGAVLTSLDLRQRIGPTMLLELLRPELRRCSPSPGLGK